MPRSWWQVNWSVLIMFKLIDILCSMYISILNKSYDFDWLLTSCQTSRRTVVSDGRDDSTKWLDRTSSFSCPLYFFPHSFSFSYFLPLFHCLILILLFPCASVWENTRASVPHSYSHTEWNLLSSGTNTRCGDVPALKNLIRNKTKFSCQTGLNTWAVDELNIKAYG